MEQNQQFEEDNYIDLFLLYIWFNIILHPFIIVNEWRRKEHGYCFLHENRYMSKLDKYVNNNPNGKLRIKQIPRNKYQCLIVDDEGNKITNICKECPMLKDVGEIIKTRDIKCKFFEKYSEIHGLK